MRKAKFKSFRRLVRELRELCPALVPVRVRRVPLKSCLGKTTAHWEGDKLSHFCIVIKKDQSWESTWETLLHEWAHCISWREGHETVTDHDAEWGVAYSRVYSETGVD